MPKGNAPNLTKLKSPSSTPNSCKKQSAISKFFTNSTQPASSPDRDDSQRNSQTKISSLDGVFTSKNEAKKRQRSPDFIDDNSKKQCIQTPSTSSSTNNVHEPCKAGNKTHSQSTHNQLSHSTMQKLNSFIPDFDESKKDPTTISIDELKRPVCYKAPDLSAKNAEDINNSCDEEFMDTDDGLSTSAHKISRESSSKTFLKAKSPKTLLKSTGKIKYTPLEQQFVDIKEKYRDAVLFVECGYKYRFFGEDAEIAAKVLKIYCHLDHNFMTASIPTHRLFVHARRLVSAGYKVGVVKQTETAALKAAGENKGAPFTRKLSALYTKSTLIGEDVDPSTVIEDSEAEISQTSGHSGYLMAVYDDISSSKEKDQKIGIVAIQPVTGDIIYDCFKDNDMRGELETRVTHIQPVEILLPQTVTKKTEKLIQDLVALSSTEEDRIRVERIIDDQFGHTQAFETVSKFYQNIPTDSVKLQELISLPVPVISCLSCLIGYLKDFHLDSVLKLMSNFTQFSDKSTYMHLPSNTISNLELFKNLNNMKEKGSLLWVLNHTKSKFGYRMLKSWIAKPLLDPSEINNRLDAIAEIMKNQVPALVKLHLALSKGPDLEKGLCSVYHKKCSTAEFYSLCHSFDRLYREIKILAESSTDISNSLLLNNTIQQIPDLLHDVHIFVKALDERAAKENDKANLFTDDSQFPKILSRKTEIQAVKKEMNEHKNEIKKTLHLFSFDYVSVSGAEYLIEVKNNNLKAVPSNWTKISGTKTVSRFHSPFIEEHFKKLNQLKEKLIIDSTEAWLGLLDDFNENYQRYRSAVKDLAVLDCLFSLAVVAKQSGYCRPVICEGDQRIQIEQGRHPVIDLLLTDQEQYVPNDTKLSEDGDHVMIITGPNMGGKSSYIRQVALITMMAQIGSYVPAESAKIGLCDAVYTRMGAADEIFKGRSTFMVELQEASDIMKHATSKSLVILDELGRGTSTHDGVAIACATLNYFITECQCFTLFVTHYPMLSEFEAMYPDVVKNFHMSFFVQDDTDAEDDQPEVITFLYQLVTGVAERSYGLNVARLASLPEDIIKNAAKKSAGLEQTITKRRTDRELLKQLFQCRPDNAQEMLNKMKLASE